MAKPILFPGKMDRVLMELARVMEGAFVSGGIGVADARRVAAEIAKEHGEFVQSLDDQVKEKQFCPTGLTQSQVEEIQQIAVSAQLNTRFLREFKNRGLLPPDFKLNVGHDVGNNDDPAPLT